MLSVLCKCKCIIKIGELLYANFIWMQDNLAKFMKASSVQMLELWT